MKDIQESIKRMKHCIKTYTGYVSIQESGLQIQLTDRSVKIFSLLLDETMIASYRTCGSIYNCSYSLQNNEELPIFQYIC